MGSKVRRRTLAAAVALLIAAGLAAGINLLSNRDRPSGADQSCEALLIFEGTLYAGQFAPSSLAIERGETIGSGVVPGCTDDVDFIDGVPEIKGPQATDATVFRVVGLDPAIAIATEVPNEFYLAAGRCQGYKSSMEFAACVRRPLSYDGLTYVATRLDASLTTGAPLGEGTRPAWGSAPAETVSVVALEGVSPRVAVSLGADPMTIYIANGECLTSDKTDLITCIESAG